MMENSIVETNNEQSGRKEQLHDLSRATIANESYQHYFIFS